jgi:hypothetical protein
MVEVMHFRHRQLAAHDENVPWSSERPTEQSSKALRVNANQPPQFACINTRPLKRQGASIGRSRLVLLLMLMTVDGDEQLVECQLVVGWLVVVDDDLR